MSFFGGDLQEIHWDCTFLWYWSGPQFRPSGIPKVPRGAQGYNCATKEGIAGEAWSENVADYLRCFFSIYVLIFNKMYNYFSNSLSVFCYYTLYCINTRAGEKSMALVGALMVLNDMSRT